MADESLYSISDEFRNERLQQQENLRLQIENMQQRDPDRSRRILSVSHVTGLPGEVVDSDLENLEKSIAAREFNIEQWRKESPAWTSFAASWNRNADLMTLKGS